MCLQFWRVHTNTNLHIGVCFPQLHGITNGTSCCFAFCDNGHMHGKHGKPFGMHRTDSSGRIMEITCSTAAVFMLTDIVCHHIRIFFPCQCTAVFPSLQILQCQLRPTMVTSRPLSKRIFAARGSLEILASA